MPDLANLDEEDEYSHRIDIDAEDDVMITEVEKGANEKTGKTKREDSGKETTDEEFVTDELFDEGSNGDKMVRAKGNSNMYSISTNKCLKVEPMMR